jgi:hypothetical protein
MDAGGKDGTVNHGLRRLQRSGSADDIRTGRAVDVALDPRQSAGASR